MSTEDEALLREIRAAFAVESEERLGTLEAQLAELERGTDAARRAALLESVYRDAHSLKGAARAISLAEVETVCQAMEGLLQRVWRNPGLPLLPGFFLVLREAIDALAGLAAGGAAAKPEAVGGLIVRLGEELARLGNLAAGEEVDHVHVPAPRQAPPVAAVAAVAAPPASGVALPRPPAAERPAEPAPAGGAAPTVRVAQAKLDGIFRRSEGLIAAKLAAAEQGAAWRAMQRRLDEAARRQEPGADAAWLREARRELKARVREAEQHAHDLGRMVDDLLDQAKDALMLPGDTLFRTFPRMVRDIARELSKEADLVVEGGEAELDRRILEDLKDPLVHLLRNALDHGLETPAERVAAGKPARGQVRIAVSGAGGGRLRLVVSDDGRGVDTARLRRKAVEAGLVGREEVAAMDEAAALRLAFRPGLSTADAVGRLSGRGLGMHIVQERVERMGGQVWLESEPGRGARTTLVLPASMSTFKGVRVEAGGAGYFLPSLQVEAVVRHPWEAVAGAAGQATVPHAGGVAPLVDLAAVLGAGREPPARQGALVALLLRSGAARVAFRVDAVHGEAEVLVKPLGPLLRRVRHLGGAAVLPSGEVLAVLDVVSLVHAALGAQAESSRHLVAPAAPAARRRVLVVEDSFTSRTLLKNILEANGFAVETAVDGEAGWAALRAGGFDAVLSDIEMPKLDGVGLTARIRAGRDTADLPVVLISSLDSAEDRRRGLEAGASAYVVKSAFDQTDLLQVLRDLL